jgi:hypothetical protein
MIMLKTITLASVLAIGLTGIGLGAAPASAQPSRTSQCLDAHPAAPSNPAAERAFNYCVYGNGL